MRLIGVRGGGNFFFNAAFVKVRDLIDVINIQISIMQWSLTNAEVVCVETEINSLLDVKVCVRCTFHKTAGVEGGSSFLRMIENHGE